MASLLTSLLPSRTATLNRWGWLDDSIWYLPDAFRRKGWTTAAFVANGNLFDDGMGFQRGVDIFRPSSIPSPEERYPGAWSGTRPPARS